LCPLGKISLNPTKQERRKKELFTHNMAQHTCDCHTG
jgi:hypothetical protein